MQGTRDSSVQGWTAASAELAARPSLISKSAKTMHVWHVQNLHATYRNEGRTHTSLSSARPSFWTALRPHACNKTSLKHVL
jgi:hypothetical protein